MAFSSPIWLIGLAPWAGVVVLVLWGRRRRVDVPFLDLWRGPVPQTRARRAMDWPPVWLVAVLGALLLAIVAAAGPKVRHPTQGPPVSIIVDRGISMSARGAGGPRLHETIDLAEREMVGTFGLGPVRLLSVPRRAPVVTEGSDWASVAKSLPLSAMDTRQGLRSAVRQELREAKGPVVVLSDQALGIEDERLVLIPPAGSMANVGIVHVAVRERPAGQVMLRLRNQSSQSRATVAILSDDVALKRVGIELPREGLRDYFIDVPALGRVVRVEVEVEVEDDLPADNRAYLVRGQSWPVIEARTPLPPGLGRLVESYGRLRPASGMSKRVAIVGGTEALPADQAAVVLGWMGGAAKVRISNIEQHEHAITRAASEWSHFFEEAVLAAAPGDGVWRPVVTSAEGVLVAVGEGPVRRVWVGVDSEAWAGSPEFVIFWTNVFTWLGEGGEVFGFDPVMPLEGGWTPVEGGVAGLWPGLYRRGEGGLRALNALDFEMPPPPGGDWRKRMAELSSRFEGVAGAWSLTAPMLMLALAAVVVAALSGPRSVRGLTLFRTTRTV